MSTPMPERGTSPEAAKKVKLENANLRIGILVAVVTLLIAVAGFLGVKLNNTTDEKQAAQGAVQTLEVVVSTQGNVLTQNSAEIQSANSAISSLQSANVSMSSQLAQAATTLPASSTRTTSLGSRTTPPVRHAGQVVIAADGRGVDLDAPKDDPTWGSHQGDGLDLGFSSGSFVPTYDTQYVLLGTSEANYQSCSDSTGYKASYGASLDPMEKGTYFCIYTAEMRYSAIHIAAQDKSSVTLSVTTYELGG